jgi:hypothetical protein
MCSVPDNGRAALSRATISPDAVSTLVSSMIHFKKAHRRLSKEVFDTLNSHMKAVVRNIVPRCTPI